MVAFTPNRGYPYAQPTDPADVPARLQAFAEAVDDDLAFFEREGQPRHMAQFRGTVTNTVPGTATSGTLTWQLTEFNTKRLDGITPPSQTLPAMVPVTDATTTQLIVNYPGFWFVSATVQFGTTPAAAGVDLVGIELMKNATVVATNPLSWTHDVTFTNDATHILDVACGVLLAPGDTMAVRAGVGRSSLAAPVQFFNRSITLLRMTQF